MSPGKERQAGLTLIEVMMATVIAGIGLAGGFGMLQWAEHGRQFGAYGTRALALAVSKLEVKRAAPWDRLLMEISEDDPSIERPMTDDGRAPDVTAGDGIYTSSYEVDGVRVIWTVQPSHRGLLNQSSHVAIQVIASYRTGTGAIRAVMLGTLRGNPRFIGPAE